MVIAVPVLVAVQLLKSSLNTVVCDHAVVVVSASVASTRSARNVWRAVCENDAPVPPVVTCVPPAVRYVAGVRRPRSALPQPLNVEESKFAFIIFYIFLFFYYYRIAVFD